jgi:hypothetical protein
MKKVGFFEESEGVKSSARLKSFLVLLFTMGFDVLWVMDNDITGNFLILNGLLLVAAFAPQYLHKLAELAIQTKTPKP